MKKLLKIIGVLTMSSILLSLPGCGNSENKQDENTTSSTKKVGHQLERPSEGEKIAVITTSEGVVKIRLFSEEAPKTVENFTELSQKGYYDNTIFHRVIKDFMVQGGDPKGDGTGGESIWGKDFEDEFNSKLFNITGSIAMANRGPNTNGSQFFINNQDSKNFKGWEQSYQYYKVYERNPEFFNKNYGGTIDMSKITDDIKKLYETNGGNPHLDGFYNTCNPKKGHTVFGQVFEGMDIINKISDAETDQNDKPLKPITIKTIKIESYHAE